MGDETRVTAREPLTIWECPECGLADLRFFVAEHARGDRAFVLCGVEPVPVRVWPDELVRPLVEAVREISEMQCECIGYYRCAGCERRGPDRAERALEAFPAPAEWMESADAR